MADDWVKMRTDLYRDPKVCMIADQMLAKDGDLAKFVSHSCRRDMTVTRNVMRNAVVGALVTVWGVLRRRGHRDGDNLTLNTATLAVIDDIADMPGLGDALEFVGWVVQDAEGVTLPNFFADYNVDPADEAKAKNAERQRRFREAKKVESSNVTVTLQRNAREEKRREEYSEQNRTEQNRGDGLALCESELPDLAAIKVEPIDFGSKMQDGAVFTCISDGLLSNPTAMCSWFRRQLSTTAPVLPGNRAALVLTLCAARAAVMKKNANSKAAYFASLVSGREWAGIKRHQAEAIKQLQEVLP